MSLYRGYTGAKSCTGGPTPGARALMAWYLAAYPKGRNDGIYNCLAGETLVMTPEGDVPIRDLAGTEAQLLTWGALPGSRRQAARWVTAPVRSFGRQRLLAVTLQRGADVVTVRATAGHRWITRYRRSGSDGGGHGHLERTTDQLKVGHVVPTVYARSAASLIRHPGAGIPHGLVFGDGTLDTTGGARIALCGAKKVALESYLSNAASSRYVDDEGHPVAVVTGMSRTWKSLPSSEESSAYLYGFLSGWFAADGRVQSNGGVTLYNRDREVLEAARRLARRCGIETHPVRATKAGGNVVAGRWVEQREMHSLAFVASHLDSSFFLVPEHRERWAAANRRRPADWKVLGVEDTGTDEEVFCAVVPGTETFVLAEGILTGNCRQVRGGGAVSLHAEGRAADLGCPEGAPWAAKLASRLKAHSADLGVQCVIFNRRIWSGARPDEGWRRYDGADAHTTHLHVELSRAAAQGLTVQRLTAVLTPKSKLAPTPALKPAQPAPASAADLVTLTPFCARVLGRPTAPRDLLIQWAAANAYLARLDGEQMAERLGVQLKAAR